MRGFFTGLWVVLCAVIYYLGLPALNLRSMGFWFYLLLIVVAVFVVMMLFELLEDYAIYVLTPFRIIIAVIVFGAISSWNLFHAEAAREVAQVTEKSFEEGFPDLLESDEALKELPIVDYDTAKLLGDKKIAGIKNSTWYEVDREYNLVKYQGEYYRLSAIVYGDYFKYSKAKEYGIPGYVLVGVSPEDGTVAQEAEIVLTEEPIKYSPGAFFGYDLRRHIHGQYPSAILGDSFLEINEKGVPFWVTEVMTPTKGLFGVTVVKSFILTNAATGESQKMKVEDAPEWVDHVYSLKYLMRIVYDHYAYIRGYMNNEFSKTDVLRTSYYYRESHRNDNKDSAAGEFANFFGYSSIISSDGDVMLYTGLTAANNAESNLGWLAINMRTGAVTQYNNIVGAEESSAQAAVETLVQAQRWEATFPLPVNIGGEPSYLMALKGKSGLVQGYGIVNVENYSIAVFSETLEGAISNYLAKNGKSGDITIDDSEQTPETNGAEAEIGTETKTGEITAIYAAEIDGTTQFYYVIDEELYRSSIMVNEKQVLLAIGDKIAFSFKELGGIRVITSLELE